MDNLVGELPKFLLAFAAVFILIVLAFWALRRFGGARLGTGSSRGRQPRLAVIDAAAVDGRRRLVLVRRDNVEHLLMIGGPSDVVIEQNIVRAVPVASARDMPAGATARTPEPRVEPAAPRAAEPAAPWPQPEAAPVRTQRPVAPPEDVDSIWSGEPAGRDRPYRPAPQPDDLRGPPVEPARSARATEAMQRIVAAAESLPRGAPLPGRERREPPLRAERREPPRTPPTTEAPPVQPPTATPNAADKAAEPAATVEAKTPPLAPDVNLADMAQRLEAALRRPIKPGERIGATPDKATAADADGRPATPPVNTGPAAPSDKTPPAPRASTPAPEAKPAASKSVLDSLEEEMASLLGRPPGKEG